MEEKEMIVIEDTEGKSMEVELITYLIGEDNINTYLVYSKGEKTGVDSDEVIYISKIISDGPVINIKEIEDDTEWINVQKLLKKIANA